MSGAVRSITGSLTGSKSAGKAAEKASKTQAAAQREALEYLKEREAIPQELREKALLGLGAEFLPEEGVSLMEQAQASPLYQQMVEAGEESVLRQASATGGLRSGNVQEALADLNQQALLDVYNQQLQGVGGLAQLPSMAREIAGGTAGIGQTLAQGQVAKGQAAQQGMGALMGLGGTLGAAAIIASDIRLKSNVELVGKKNGHNWYEWEWNDEAYNKYGLKGRSEGVMAHEVAEYLPEAINSDGGYLLVNYPILGVDE